MSSEYTENRSLGPARANAGTPACQILSISTTSALSAILEVGHYYRVRPTVDACVRQSADSGDAVTTAGACDEILGAGEWSKCFMVTAAYPYVACKALASSGYLWIVKDR